MTRPPSEAVDLTHLIPHLQEHLLHVGCAPKGDGFLTKSGSGKQLVRRSVQMPFGGARASEMPNQLPRKLVDFGALEIEKFLTSETENRRTEDDRYVDALAIEDISVHRKVSYFPFTFSPSSTKAAFFQDEPSLDYCRHGPF